MLELLSFPRGHLDSKTGHLNTVKIIAESMKQTLTIRDAKKRRAMEVLRLTGRKKRKGGGKGGDEEDGASGLESDSDSEDEDLEAVNEILREELGGSDSDDSLDSDDIPLGAENWDPDKIKAGQKAAQAAGRSESDDDDESSGESSSDEDDAGEGGGGESKTRKSLS